MFQGEQILKSYFIFHQLNKLQQIQFELKQKFIMQELKLILIKKAKIISQSRYPKKNNREAILKYFKKIKKQLKQNQQNEQRLIDSLYQGMDIDQSNIEKFYFHSFTIMKSFHKKFQFIPEEKDLFVNIVDMHYNFYFKQEYLEKAQEIKSIYRKKTCSKELFLTLLLKWLHQWSKCKLQKFIHKNIQSIQKDLLLQKLQSPKKMTEELQKQNITNQISLDGTLKQISFSQKLSKNDFKIVLTGSKNNFQKELQQMDISPFTENQRYEINQFLINSQNRLETSTEIQKSSESPAKNQFIKHRSKSYNTSGRQKTVIQINVNKQIFYGSFWKEMNQYYRNLNCIQDLDMYYLKTFKKQKQQSKQQILQSKMQQLIQNVIKSMPHIKKSLETYEKSYDKNCPIHIKQMNQIIKNQNMRQWEQLKSNKSKQMTNALSIPHNNNKQFLNCIFSQQRYASSNLKTFRRKYQSQRIASQNQLCTQKYSNYQLSNEPNIFKDKAKQNVINKILQRNKSYNDTFVRKSIRQEKATRQIKLPVVYNPEHICNQRESDAQKSLMIHQKFQKFIINGPKPAKGLNRYRLMSKDRQKSLQARQENSQQKLPQTFKISIQLNPKQSQYEVASIRKMLRKKQKQRQKLSFQRSSIVQTQIQSQQVQNAILQIKVIESLRKQEQKKKNNQKYDVFLNNLKNSSSPFKLKYEDSHFKYDTSRDSYHKFQSNFNQEMLQSSLPKI